VCVLLVVDSVLKVVDSCGCRECCLHHHLPTKSRQTPPIPISAIGAGCVLLSHQPVLELLISLLDPTGSLWKHSASLLPAVSPCRARLLLLSLQAEAGRFENVVAVVDPPRAGLHRTVLRALLGCAAIKRLVYVSCNPDSLALNAAVLCGRYNESGNQGRGVCTGMHMQVLFLDSLDVCY
jgi:tRNA (Uracil-5-)-methyltransferase